MKDIDKLTALLDEFGVGWEFADDERIVCCEGLEKITGYNGFYTTFDFDVDGKFICMGAYE